MVVLEPLKTLSDIMTTAVVNMDDLSVPPAKKSKRLSILHKGLLRPEKRGFGNTLSDIVDLCITARNRSENPLFDDRSLSVDIPRMISSATTTAFMNFSAGSTDKCAGIVARLISIEQSENAALLICERNLKFIIPNRNLHVKSLQTGDLVEFDQTSFLCDGIFTALKLRRF